TRSEFVVCGTTYRIVVTFSPGATALGCGSHDAATSYPVDDGTASVYESYSTLGIVSEAKVPVVCVVAYLYTGPPGPEPIVFAPCMVNDKYGSEMGPESFEIAHESIEGVEEASVVVSVARIASVLCVVVETRVRSIDEAVSPAAFPAISASGMSVLPS